MNRLDAAASVSDDDADRDLAGALHDVSNALTVVLGWLEAARAGVPAGPARAALDVATRHARLGHRAARRAIGASEPPAESEARARQVASEALCAVEPEAQKRGVQLLLDESDADDLWVDAPAAVQQILINLLLNAIAFTPAGLSVRLVLEGGLDVVFRVADEGPGVPPSLVGQLFAGGASEREGGAGIGLRHAHALAVKHHGVLRHVPSRVGASFELCWPGRAPASSLSVRRSVGALTGKRVLLIEDDLAVVSLIEMGLAVQGAEVTAVTGYAELQRIVTECPAFDAALIDLSPIADGRCAAFRQFTERYPDLPLIVISGTCLGAASFDLPAAKRWVRKPFEISELVEALQGV